MIWPSTVPTQVEVSFAWDWEVFLQPCWMKCLARISSSEDEESRAAQWMHSTEHSPEEGQCGKHWIHWGTIPPPLSQGCLKVEQGVTEGWDGSCSSSLPQPPRHWSKMSQHAIPKQYNCSIHLCPQHRNNFYWSGGLQHRWVHILYGSSVFCYRPKAEFQQTAALLSRLSCCLMEAESLLLLPCIRATCSAAECSHIHRDIPIPACTPLAGLTI